MNVNIGRMVAEPKSQPQGTPAGGGETTKSDAGSTHSFASALQNAHDSNPRSRKDPQGSPNSYPAVDAQLAAQVSAMQPVPAPPADAPTSFSIALPPPTKTADAGTQAGLAGASIHDVRGVLDAQSLQANAGASQSGGAVLGDFAMLAGLPKIPQATADAGPEIPATTAPSHPALPSPPSPAAASPAKPQANLSPTKPEASPKAPAASAPAEPAPPPVAADKRTPASPDTRSGADKPPSRNESPNSHLPSYAARTENRGPGAPSSNAQTANAAAERTAKTGGRAASDGGDEASPSTPAAATAPGPVALEAVHSLPTVSDNANVVTAVNGSSPEVKSTTADPLASTGAAVSAANQAVLRRAAAGEIHVPELGRVAVRAEGTPGAINVEVSVDRAETHAVLHASAGALAADLRQADVPLGHLRFDRGNAQGAPGDSGTGYGTSSQNTPRDSHSSSDADEADDTTPTAAAGRVRIVL